MNKIPLTLFNHRFYAPLVIVQRRTMGAGTSFGGKANKLAKKFANTRIPLPPRHRDSRAVGSTWEIKENMN